MGMCQPVRLCVVSATSAHASPVQVEAPPPPPPAPTPDEGPSVEDLKVQTAASLIHACLQHDGGLHASKRQCQGLPAGHEHGAIGACQQASTRGCGRHNPAASERARQGCRLDGVLRGSLRLLPEQAQLLDSLFGTERGLSASSEVRAEINELITQLEAKNPNPSLMEVWRRPLHPAAARPPCHVMRVSCLAVHAVLAPIEYHARLWRFHGNCR